MVSKSLNISLNSFGTIINFGINVNSQTKKKNTPLHFIDYKFSENVQNIIGLFVDHGANLNITNCMNRTILDISTYYELNEHTKIIIMTLIDAGAKRNNTFSEHMNNNVLEFIELYRLSNIRPAIKNEIKI